MSALNAFVLCGVVGVSVAAGLQHLLIWRYLRQEKVYAAFGLMCLSLAAYAICSILLYRATTVSEYVLAFKLQASTACFFYTSGLWFTAFFTNRRGRASLYTLSALFGLAVLLNAISPYGILFSSVSEMEYLVWPLG